MTEIIIQRKRHLFFNHSVQITRNRRFTNTVFGKPEGRHN